MTPEHLQSPAKDFCESPGKERGGNPDCDLTGFVIGSCTFQHFNGGPGFNNRIGVFNLNVLPSTLEGKTFPKQDYWKLRVTATVLERWPDFVGPDGKHYPRRITMCLMSWNAASGIRTNTGTSLEGSPQGKLSSLSSSAALKFYYDDGGEFLTEERPIQPFLSLPGGTATWTPPRMLYADYQTGYVNVPNLPPYTFEVPNEIGTHVFNFKIRSRPFCHTWFFLNFLSTLGPYFDINSGVWSYENAGDVSPTDSIKIEHTIRRVFKMLVRYIVLTNGFVGVALQFTDVSKTDNFKVAWLWNFGDGTTSTLQNPVHTYAAPGNYVVNLQITDSGEETYAAAGENILTIHIV